MATVPEKPCTYLPDRMATLRAFYVGRLPGRLYHDFMDAGFRRSGRIIYQPVCRGCRECLPIRVPVFEFAPDKSLRRCRKRNEELVVSVGKPALTDEKCDLYRRYLALRHDGSMDDDSESLEAFLYQSPVDTAEFTYRDPAGKLLAVGICDVCPESLSSVYFYYDPDQPKRGLGNFGALAEIDYARRAGIPYWYLGYWVRGCRAMAYKATFRPHEILHPDGVWRPESAPT